MWSFQGTDMSYGDILGSSKADACNHENNRRQYIQSSIGILGRQLVE